MISVFPFESVENREAIALLKRKKPVIPMMPAFSVGMSDREVSRQVEPDRVFEGKLLVFAVDEG